MELKKSNGKRLSVSEHFIFRCRLWFWGHVEINEPKFQIKWKTFASSTKKYNFWYENGEILYLEDLLPNKSRQLKKISFLPFFKQKLKTIFFLQETSKNVLVLC